MLNVNIYFSSRISRIGIHNILIYSGHTHTSQNSYTTYTLTEEYLHILERLYVCTKDGAHKNLNTEKAKKIFSDFSLYT